jgi:WD40-like Beta Propeller Repeat
VTQRPATSDSAAILPRTVGPGLYTVTALVAVGVTLLGCGSDTSSQPTEPAAVELRITPSWSAVRVHDSIRYSASIVDSRGATLPTTTVEWSSSDTTVLRVLTDGWVRGVGVGSVVLTATSGSLRASVEGAVTPGDPVLRIRARSNAADTINSSAADPLVAELIDGEGAPVSGEEVRFTVVESPEYVPLFLTRLGGGWGTNRLADTTDALGHAGAGLILSFRAGLAQVRIESGAFQIVAAVDVAPGTPVRFGVEPIDTVVYVGHGYSLRGRGYDRHGNPVDDAASVTGTATGAVSASEEGEVTGVLVGRDTIVVRVADLTDTAFVTVPPVGTIAASGHPATGAFRETQVVTTNLDGSNFQTLVKDPDSWAGSATTWLPNGDGVVFSMGKHTKRIYVLDTLGVRFFLRGDAGAFGEHSFPTFSRDGAWLYFNGARFGDTRSEIWRSRADGTDWRRFGPAAGTYDADVQPDPSPDGSNLVYHTNRGPGSGSVIRVMDASTGAVNAIDVPGAAPRWSPDGRTIAYTVVDGYVERGSLGFRTGELRLMQPDGTGVRTLATGTVTFSPYLSWSPDGEFLIAASSRGMLELIRVSTGEVLPLAFTEGLIAPTWRWKNDGS